MVHSVRSFSWHAGVRYGVVRVFWMVRSFAGRLLRGEDVYLQRAGERRLRFRALQTSKIVTLFY